ncbi:hypothetical protein Ancab_003928 [Ancistrocladus abbreviatus]
MEITTEVKRGKLFIGGISRDTTEETLKEHFAKYGELEECLVIRHKQTGVCRGFGFVTFSDPSIANQVLQHDHVILGKQVELKQAILKSEIRPEQDRQNDTGVAGARYSEGKKIFIGGLHPDLTKEELKTYFSSFGSIKGSVVLHDKETGKSRCFAFITFDSEDAVKRVLRNPFHVLRNKRMEVKRAIPKERDNKIRNKSLDYWNAMWFPMAWDQQPLPPTGLGINNQFPAFSYGFLGNAHGVASYYLPYYCGQCWYGPAPSAASSNGMGPFSNRAYINGNHSMHDFAWYAYQDTVRSDAPCSEVSIIGNLREETASSGAAGAKNTNTGSSGADGAKNTSCRITVGDGDRDNEKVSTTKNQEEAHCCKLTEGKSIDEDGVSHQDSVRSDAPCSEVQSLAISVRRLLHQVLLVPKIQTLVHRVLMVLKYKLPYHNWRWRQG